MPDDVYAAIYDNTIESVGGTPGFVIQDGVDRERFTIADVNNRDVTVWKKLGYAEVTFVVDEVGP